MKFFPLVLLIAFALPTQANDVLVHSADELDDVVETLQPGDTVVLSDGTWTDQALVFTGRGAAEAPITLRPQTPGGVTLTGQSNLSISGEYLVVDGLNFVAGGPGDLSHVIQFRGPLGDATHCRLTNTQIKDYNPTEIDTRYFWVSLYGQHNRVDHCRFVNQNHSGVTLVAWIEEQAVHHQIDHNHFLDRPLGNGNGFETIRLGTSKYSNTDAHVLVKHNVFERCDGEIEIISNKSNNNTFLGNTFLDSAGTLTLRHGHRAVVDGNFFLGQGKARSGGIRVMGEDHVVTHNTIADVDDRMDGAISIAAGIENTPANGYQQVKNATIAHNTIVNVKGAAISMDWGIGERQRTLLPEGVTIADNRIQSTHAPLFEGEEGPGFIWQNNLVHGSPLGLAPRDGIVVTDYPMFTLGENGLWQTTPDFQQTSISSSNNSRRPLSGQDVGPDWLK
ncbi:MAG: polysaccharide lyase 6 family protein [Planctomycetota bacterium]